MKKASVRYPICCTSILLNNLRADIFKFDPNYLENEQKYKAIKADTLGEGSSAMSQVQKRAIAMMVTKVCLKTRTFPPSLLMYLSAVPEKEGVEDLTETNLVNLRRVIYLTITNALNYEEVVHKLLKVTLKEDEEVQF